MKLRFQADNDLDQRIVVATRRLDPTIDFQIAQALKLHGVPDTLVLKRAAEAARILVSHDRRTLPGFFREFISTNASPGLIILSQRLPGKAAELLHLLWAASEAEEYVNIIYSLP
ncbi:MAG TPA: DUF5615 family PIN-like protein [Pyrinomonadaceae bacterium]|jgi:hypothetical protein